MRDKKRLVGMFVVAMAAGVLVGGVIAPPSAHADANGQQITSLGLLGIDVQGDGVNVTKATASVTNVPSDLSGMCYDFRVFGQTSDDVRYESPVISAGCGAGSTWADFDINRTFAANSRLCAAVRKSVSDPWEHDYACVWIEP